jgi:hypothetical protein
MIDYVGTKLTYATKVSVANRFYAGQAVPLTGDYVSGQLTPYTDHPREACWHPAQDGVAFECWAYLDAFDAGDKVKVGIYGCKSQADPPTAFYISETEERTDGAGAAAQWYCFRILRPFRIFHWMRYFLATWSNATVNIYYGGRYNAYSYAGSGVLAYGAYPATVAVYIPTSRGSCVYMNYWWGSEYPQTLAVKNPAHNTSAGFLIPRYKVDKPSVPA